MDAISLWLIRWWRVKIIFLPALMTMTGWAMASISGRAYDSVRGVFWEGKPLYPNAGFAEKNHIQICVCNPNCIKGYFLPRGIDKAYPNP